MLSTTHSESLAEKQFRLGADLLTRLDAVGSYAELVNVLEDAEEDFDQLEVRAHAVRVAQTARDLAEHCGFDARYCNRLYNATRLHDIGKLFMPTHILEKDGRPTPMEFELIKEHARHGGELLAKHSSEFTVNVARYHHERYDGKGYNGLAGEFIPIEARLVQIADVYDALRSKRAYKEGMSEQETLEKMVAIHIGGCSFDPFFVREFVGMRLAADVGREISEDARAKLGAFASSHPMTEIKKLEDRSILGGWEIDRIGNRKLWFHDAAVDYRKVAVIRDLHGEETFNIAHSAPLATKRQMEAGPSTPRL